MANKGGKDVQLSFEFDTSNQKVRFITINCRCKCGFSCDFKKADLVLEMTVLCPKCGSVIIVK